MSPRWIATTPPKVGLALIPVKQVAPPGVVGSPHLVPHLLPVEVPEILQDPPTIETSNLLRHPPDSVITSISGVRATLTGAHTTCTATSSL